MLVLIMNSSYKKAYDETKKVCLGRNLIGLLPMENHRNWWRRLNAACRIPNVLRILLH